MTVTMLRVFLLSTLLLSVGTALLAFYLGIHWLAFINAALAGINFTNAIIAWTVLKP